MTMVTKNELQEIGFGPMEAVEEILGISLSESQVNKNA